jgi:hypothetical protein
MYLAIDEISRYSCTFYYLTSDIYVRHLLTGEDYLEQATGLRW